MHCIVCHGLSLTVMRPRQLGSSRGNGEVMAVGSSDALDQDGPCRPFQLPCPTSYSDKLYRVVPLSRPVTTFSA
jgi:hypothetical protein